MAPYGPVSYDGTRQDERWTPTGDINGGRQQTDNTVGVTAATNGWKLLTLKINLVIGQKQCPQGSFNLRGPEIRLNNCQANNAESLHMPCIFLTVIGSVDTENKAMFAHYLII